MGSVWLIAGPTASGKSALAVGLAEALGGEIVNADSMQLYRDLHVLTARPPPADEARVAHHLYGVADAADGWSVGRWLTAARAVLAGIAGRGRAAVVVGGTGLYFRALTHGLADIPAVPEAVRRAVEARFEALGEAAIRDTLGRVDPAAAARIFPGDRQRLVRALAVAESTGRALSDWQAETAAPDAGGAYARLVLEPPRDALYARCDRRFTAMLDAGALDEARALLARRLDPSLPLMKAVGLRELGRHLSGEITLEAAATLAAQETRRYAKRQSTWFRNQAADWPRLEAFGETVEVEAILSKNGRA
jgi:tRNA dimethylallyltransferase